MVLTTLDPDALAATLANMQQRGLPTLFVPRANQFVTVATLPLLGTGKLDLCAVKQMCLEAAGSEVGS